MNNFQDWKIINIGKYSNKIHPNEVIEKREKLKKINNNSEILKIKTIPLNLSNEIISIRHKLKLTPKEFSNKLNIDPSIYTDIESGKAIYNNNINQIIYNIEKIFNIKLLYKK